VIACYSDPGLHLCREATARPVFGIAECGVLTALAAGERFGVIAIKQRSIQRHVRYLRQMGLTERLAGERPLEMSVAETASGEGTLTRMIAVGAELRDRDGPTSSSWAAPAWPATAVRWRRRSESR
jgi:Asp/Glu/hydantoin racemase